MSGPIAGIDLGTTHSLIGVMDAGFPVLIADAEGHRLTPSAVGFSEAGEVMVGRAAVRMRAVAPERVISSIKRWMGRRVGEPGLPEDPSVAGRVGEMVRLRGGGREHAPEELSALVLAKLKADAERALGQVVGEAVITVPAYFNDAQRQATIRAGESAGFRVARIVNEPTAAALAYGLDRLGRRTRVAVYDLGGGTFDISILELEDGAFRVLSTHGDTRLGGDDLDRMLARDFVAEIPEWRKREIVIEAKHRLSDAEEAVIALPFEGGEYRLRRDRLEALARPWLERTRRPCLQALSDAGLGASDLDAVILVGGQTRMPLVRRFVGALFGREPDTSQHPDETVALGATIQAGVISGAVRDVVLLDVTPLSLGIETFGGLMNVIIPRNTTIPAKAGEMFTNAVAGQTSMLIRVLQGEREMARDNWPLGEFVLGFAPAPKGAARVGVQFSLDENGVLHVLARDTGTGAEKTVEIRSAVDVADEKVEAMVQESVEHALTDMGERAFAEAKLKADDLLAAVERGLKMVGEALGAEDRAVIAARVEEVRAAATARDARRLGRANADLDEATEHLAALLIEKAMGES